MYEEVRSTRSAFFTGKMLKKSHENYNYQDKRFILQATNELI